MRITTRMLDESFRKAGVSMPRKSLLDYINKDTSDNTLLTALNKGNKAGDLLNKRNYEKIQKAADNLVEQTEVFTAEGKDAIFEKIKNGADKKELYSQVEQMVGSYNTTMDALQSSGDTMNRYYCQMLKLTAAENKDALASIGIQISSGGKLSIDKEKLEAADIETVEKVLGASGSFSSKTGFMADKISDNARANVESISTQYDANANSYTEILSKYDVRW